ncbi:hypothetical protein NliqN6_6004 [Naganishia liquefaciens]|uniref:Uncharacterized protein n=1 Tax=Naganishia liquefaciens TaxID=104408 RepID=A0A8H3TYU0_9TREE|nr:hypothetical protein NliqN6_6004 [Naganishia liquefaciens]
MYYLQTLDKSVGRQGANFDMKTEANLVGRQYCLIGSSGYRAQLGWQPVSALSIIKVPTQILMTRSELTYLSTITFSSNLQAPLERLRFGIWYCTNLIGFLYGANPLITSWPKFRLVFPASAAAANTNALLSSSIFQGEPPALWFTDLSFHPIQVGDATGNIVGRSLSGLVAAVNLTLEPTAGPFCSDPKMLRSIAAA